jgi:hypothetical protein
MDISIGMQMALVIGGSVTAGLVFLLIEKWWRDK